MNSFGVSVSCFGWTLLSREWTSPQHTHIQVGEAEECFFFFSVKAFKHISQKYFRITMSNESNINQMMFETSLPIVYRTRRKPLSTFKEFESNNHLNLIWCLCIYKFKLVSVSAILNSALVWVLLSYFCFQMPCAIFSLKKKICFSYPSSLASYGDDPTVLVTSLGLWKELVKVVISCIYS